VRKKTSRGWDSIVPLGLFRLTTGFDSNDGWKGG
jgi:hypothetical protein